MALLLSERTRPALEALTHAIDAIRRGTRGGVLPMLLFLRGMIRVRWLELDGAIADFEAAEESARLPGLIGIEQWAIGALTGVHHLGGESAVLTRSSATFERMLEGAKDTTVNTNGRCNRAATREDSDPERCVQEMLEFGGATLERVDPTWSIWQLRVLVRATLVIGRVEEADRRASVAEERAHHCCYRDAATSYWRTSQPHPGFALGEA